MRIFRVQGPCVVPMLLVSLLGVVAFFPLLCRRSLLPIAICHRLPRRFTNSSLFLPFHVPSATPPEPASNASRPDDGPLLYSYEVTNEYPHDRNAFTQGLLYYGDNILYESTGLNYKSTVREVELNTGKVKKQQRMADHYFGEGLAQWGDKLFQLAWQIREGFIYERETLKEVGKFQHPMNDGWGLTSDSHHLIGSDGSSTLFFLSPEDFREVRRITVTDGDREVHRLNELEVIGDAIWANVWLTDCIAKISPQDGRVIGWLDLEALRQKLTEEVRVSEQTVRTGIDVLNGIAWDSARERLFVTGKLWPKLYEIKAKPITRPEPGALAGVRQRCLR